ncbi:hypothetical protein ABID19_004037 [Mesorhizobium robiniae]|uniref:Transposase n=1 Tax=Mesorhizobium robiniae TaxID=559315 RepID=A0ABV2GRT0_9HYPH
MKKLGRWDAGVWRAALFVAGVIERSTGAAGCGAVLVGGTDWKVRVPRLPKLPPRRASA